MNPHSQPSLHLGVLTSLTRRAAVRQSSEESMRLQERFNEIPTDARPGQVCLSGLVRSKCKSWGDLADRCIKIKCGVNV